jgi:hypothetical protein
MRKKAGFIIFTLLLLTVPALANAWNLTVKVAGGDTTNFMTISYGTTARDAVKGTFYLYPQSAVTLAAHGAAPTSIVLDGGTSTTAAAFVSPTTGSHTLVVTYPAAVVDTGASLALTQNITGGQLYAQNRNNTWTGTGVSGLANNDSVTVYVIADGNHKIAWYDLGDGTHQTAGITGMAGQSLSVTGTATNPGKTVKAQFDVSARTTVSLNAPTDATTSNGAWGAPGTNPVVVTATAVSNDTGLQYAFAVSGPQTIAGQAKSSKTTFSFSPTTVGAYTVTATVTSANDSVGTLASATVKVTSNQVSLNQGCTSCHSTQSPAIVSGYLASAHGLSAEASCEGCHTSATPHSAGVNSLNVNPATFIVVSSATNGVAKGAVFCTKCHTGYYPIPHPTTGQTKTCAACHLATDAHSVHVATLPPVVDAKTTDCSKCHAAESGNFTGSIHWVTVANDGYHYDTNPLVPNAEARDLTCVYRCHFKATNYVPGSVPGNNTIATAYGCGTCHSGALAAGGSVTATPTAVHGVPATAANTCRVCHSGGKHETTTHAANHATATDCIVCHNAHTLRTGLPHQNYSSSVSNPNYRASYVTPRTTCATCHFAGPANDGYDSVRTAWKESGHGDNNGLAWKDSASHVWKNSGTAVNFQTTIPATDCVRCHNAKGFAAFATSGFTNVSSLHATDKESEPLACNACHVADASGAVTAARLPVAKVATFYNISTVDKTTKLTVKSRISATFPDVGESNICISCHSARVVGSNLAEAFATGNWNLSNTSFQNSHYMAAAGMMYNTVGFKNFTGLNTKVATNNEGAALTFSAAKTYNLLMTAAVAGKGGVGADSNIGVAGGVTSSHKMLGTPSTAGTEDYLLPPSTALTTNGPCVTCHMKAYEPIAGNNFTPPPAGRMGAGHSLKIDEATAQQLCLECHADAPHLDGGDGHGAALYTDMKNLVDLEKAMIEPQSECYQNGLTLIKKMLETRYMIKYDGSLYPYFYDLQKDPAGKTAVTDWTRTKVPAVSGYSAAATAAGLAPLSGALTQVQAYRLMGACYNLNVMARDPGGYLHARTYSQRLVYDTVDYLDNNLMDFSALNSARAMTTANVAGLVDTFKGNNVNVHASDGTLATESMIWLSGTHYNDTNVGNAMSPMKLHP